MEHRLKLFQVIFIYIPSTSIWYRIWSEYATYSDAATHRIYTNQRDAVMFQIGQDDMSAIL